MKRIIALTAVAVSLAAGFVRRRHVVGARVRRGARERACRSRLHLPDAPGLPQRSSWQLPELRHAARGGSYGSVNGRRRCRPRAPAWRRAGKSRAAAGDRHSARRRQPVGRHPAAADDRARDARREPDLSDRRRRERLGPERGERDNGRRREEGPAARIVPRARGRVQECAAVGTTPASRRSTAWPSRSRSRRLSLGRNRTPPGVAR